MRPILYRFAIAAFAATVAAAALGFAASAAQARPITCFNCYGVYGPSYAYDRPYFTPYRHHYWGGYHAGTVIAIGGELSSTMTMKLLRFWSPLTV